MIRLHFTETGMEYKCDKKEEERVKKIIPCVISGDINALYTMGLVSTEIFTDGRILFKFEDDIILDIMMNPNPITPYKNDCLQVYYCKIKMLKRALEDTNNEVNTFMGRIGEKKEEEQQLPSTDSSHIIYNGKEYEIIYTNTCIEDASLQKGERAIIINDDNNDYALMTGAYTDVNDTITKDTLTDYILEEGNKIDQKIEFTEDPFIPTGMNIDDIEKKADKNNDEQMKELFDKDVESLDPFVAASKDPKEYFPHKFNSTLKELEEIEEEKAKEDVKPDPDKDPFVAATKDREEYTIHFINGVMKEVNRMKNEKAKEDAKQDKKE